MVFKLEQLKILVVDDMEPMASLIVQILRTLGFNKIIVATDGKAGFEEFCKLNPDLVITDWHMPNINGIDFLKAIRTSKKSPNKTVPVLMISGYSAPSRVSCSRDTGVTEYLSKPFTAESLAIRISHMIKHPRDFVACDQFFGPDRRRRPNKSYQGQMKRETDILEISME